MNLTHKKKNKQLFEYALHAALMSLARPITHGQIYCSKYARNDQSRDHHEKKIQRDTQVEDPTDRAAPAYATRSFI